MDEPGAERPAPAGPVGAPGAWAAPGAPSDVGGPAVAAAPADPGGWGPSAGPSPDEVLPPEPTAVPRPFPLRPLTVADVLDGAFSVIKARPRTVFAITAVFVIPLELLAAFAQRSQLAVSQNLLTDPTTFGASTGSASDFGDFLIGILVSIGRVLILPFVGASLACLVAGWYADVDLSAGEALKRGLRHTPALLGAFVLVHVAELAGAFAFLIGAVVPMTFFLVTAPAIALEGIGPIRGISRSAALVVRRFWAVLLVVLLTFVLSFALDTSLSLIPEIVSLALPEAIAWVAFGVAASLSALVVTPFVTGVAVLVYFDLRIRAEGLDIELAAGEAFPRADT